MKQKANDTGILNTDVSRAVLQAFKAKAQAEGRTLAWMVEQAMIAYMHGERSAPAAGEAPPRPAITPREFAFRRCKPVSSPAGYDTAGVMIDPETRQYWAVIGGKQQGDWCETQQEAEELLSRALDA